MDVLKQLFGSEKKVKIIRLFLFNPHEPFDLDKIASRTQLHKNSVKKYVGILEDIGLIHESSFVSPDKSTAKKKKGWVLNNEFRYLDPLHHMLIKNDPVSKERVLEKVSEVGEIKLLILSGIFLQEWGARVDIFVVGDRVDDKKLEQVVRDLESEIGKELTYAHFTTKEFNYRQNIYDKLIRDILDYPHEKVLDKMEVEIDVE